MQLLEVLKQIYAHKAEQLENCIAIQSDNTVYIQEIDKKSCFIDPQKAIPQDLEDRCFKITSNGKAIVLWAIDACFMNSSEPSRADCVFFTEDELCFIEFKTEGKRKNLATNTKDGCEQLEATISEIHQLLAQHQLEIAHQKEAYLHLGRFFPHQKSSFGNFKERFATKFQVELKFDKFKEILNP